jgi:succinyl-diaminopimelate desuccinylase
MSALGLPDDAVDALCRTIDGRREELVELTRDLVRFPTINPPGEAYRPCVEFIGARMRRRGFIAEYVRAEGTPGDHDRYPRVNVIARRESGTAGPCVHSRRGPAGRSIRSPA